MGKLVGIPVLLLVALLVYIQFEVPILDMVLGNVDDGMVAAMAIGRLDTLGRKDVIVRQLTSPCSRVRLFAIRKLTESKDAELWSYLPALIEDPDQEVRYEAIVSCGELGVTDTGAKLLALLESSLPTAKHPFAVETRCLVALGKMEYGPAVGALARVAEDPKSNPLCRKPAVDGLLQWRSKSVIPFLRSTLERKPYAKDSVPMVGRLAVVEGSTADPVFVGLLRSREPLVRAAAAEALVVTKSKESVPQLEAALAGEKDKTTRTKLQAAVKELKGK